MTFPWRLAAISQWRVRLLLKAVRAGTVNSMRWGRALENRRLKVENRTYQTNLESLVEARTDQLQTAMTDLERSYDITLQAWAMRSPQRTARRGPFKAGYGLYHGHCPRHGPTARADRRDRPRSVPARYWQEAFRIAFCSSRESSTTTKGLIMREHCYSRLSNAQEDSLPRRSLRDCLLSPGNISMDPAIRGA